MRAIVKHFISELDRGLSKAGGNIPMIPGWVMDFPTGKETGSYLAIDLGGTNLRVVLVKLGGNRDFDTTQSKFALPAHMRTATLDELWDFIAKCLKEFVDEIYPDGCSEPLPLVSHLVIQLLKTVSMKVSCKDGLKAGQLMELKERMLFQCCKSY